MDTHAIGMDNTKQRKQRVRKQVAPEIGNLKRSLSAALKAAWHVEQIKARLEKPKRERNTLQRKLEAQRVALLALKAAADAALAAITPEAASPQEGTPVLTPEPQLVSETAAA